MPASIFHQNGQNPWNGGSGQNGRNDDHDTWSHEEVADLPLPGPALIIDVRHFENRLDFEPMELLVDLWTEIRDVSAEMRQHGMESWGNLQSFLSFRKLNRGDLAGYTIYDPASWEPGREPDSCPADRLAPFLGNLVNEVRNRRIGQARVSDPGQGTVRVFFLVDLADQESEDEFPSPIPAARTTSSSSFELAVQCSSLLKTWLAKEQGLRAESTGKEDDLEPRWRRANYGAMLETVAICLNTRIRKHYPLLTNIEAVRALDMLILVQSYRQDYGYLDLQAQVSHAELILTALLLHWPEAMQAGIEDAEVSLAGALPRPVYLLGAATIEHAARWGERWWNYGLETAVLEQLLAGDVVEKQEMLLRNQVQEWWTRWHGQVRGALTVFRQYLPQLDGLRTLENLSLPGQEKANSFAELQQQTETFFARIEHFYGIMDRGTLRELLAGASLLIELGEQLSRPPAVAEDRWNADLENLRRPGYALQVYLLALFTQARGSIPRALRHLQLLEEQAERLHTANSRCDPAVCLDDWRNWYAQALTRLADLARNRPRSARREKKLVQKEREALLRSAQALHSRHYGTIIAALEARYQLALLAEADFVRPYSKRVQELQLFLNKTRARARYLRDVAGRRLALGARKPLLSPDWPRGGTTTLLNRQDYLDQQVLLRHFERTLDALHAKEESFSIQFLAQSALRFLGPVESLNGHLSGAPRLLNEQEALEQLQVLEILLVSAFLTSRAGASLTRMEPLLARYRQVIQRLQPAPGLLVHTLREMEETVRFVSLQSKIYANKLSAGILWTVPDELPLAALVAGQPRDPELSSTLAPTNLLRFLAEKQDQAPNVLLQLDQQSLLSGFPDTVRGEETCYLYLPPGWESELFEAALDHQSQSSPSVHLVRIADLQKMIYLRVHRIYQFSGDDLL